MRRIVRDRVTFAVDREKAVIEEWMMQRLRFPEAFPFMLSEQRLSILETRTLKIAPLVRADWPPVGIQWVVRAALAARARKLGSDPGPRTFELDVLIVANGAVRGDGQYDVSPESAVVKAWWA